MACYQSALHAIQQVPDDTMAGAKPGNGTTPGSPLDAGEALLADAAVSGVKHATGLDVVSFGSPIDKSAYVSSSGTKTRQITAANDPRLLARSENNTGAVPSDAFEQRNLSQPAPNNIRNLAGIQTCGDPTWSLGKYLLEMNLASDGIMPLRPDLATLHRVVSQHVMMIPYQNFQLFQGEKADLSKEALAKKLLDDRNGGMCYEIAELMFYALTELGFTKVTRFPAFPWKDEPFNADALSTHVVLIVEVDGKTFVVDVGYGYQSIRSPLEIDFTAETGRVQVVSTEYEKYRLVTSAEYHRLDVWWEGDWFKLYRLPRLSMIKPGWNPEVDCMKLIDSSVPIRRRYVKVSLILPDGRVGFHFEPRSNPVICFRILAKGGEIRKTEYSNTSDFAEGIRRDIGLQVPSWLLDAVSEV